MTRNTSQPTILFYGTEAFGAAMLATLFECDDWTIIGAVTQPDRPAGRHGLLHESPVKQFAQLHNISIFQPETLKNITLLQKTETDNELPCADIQIVCQYGLIIPKRIVEAPRFGTLNVHTSLLPAYRGASPIQTAILNGETQTGVTIMCMDEKMDHGPLLSQEKISITPDDTTPSLSASMIPVAQKLLITNTRAWLAGAITAQEQNHTQATFCRQFEKKDGLIDFTLSGKDIYNRFRAFTPWPGTYALWHGQTIKFHKLIPAIEHSSFSPGTILVENNRIFLGLFQWRFYLKDK